VYFFAIVTVEKDMNLQDAFDVSDDMRFDGRLGNFPRCVPSI
jgi:hypothetical protein